MFHRIKLLSFFVAVYAFTSDAKVIDNIGLSFGGGQSFEVDYNERTYSKFSLSLALSVESFESRYFSLKSFIGYDQKGSNDIYFTFTDVGLNAYDSLVDEKRRSDYLSIRFLGKFKILPKTIIKPHFLFGPRIDYLLKRTVEDTWIGAKEYDITDNTTKWQYGISTGIGTEFKISKILISPYALANIDFNKSKAEFGNEYRNVQYIIALDIAYDFE